MWELDHKESWVPKNWCFWTVMLEKTLESPLETARRSNQSVLKKSILNIHWKDWCWSWSSSTLATWWEELTPCKRPWCWERLKPGEGDDRGWDGWMASPTQWTWVWVNSRSWWWTGRPKYWSFSFGISSSNEYSGWISSRIDWLDLLAVQGTLKSLLQHHSSKASVLQHSAFFTV